MAERNDLTEHPRDESEGTENETLEDLCIGGTNYTNFKSNLADEIIDRNLKDYEFKVLTESAEQTTERPHVVDFKHENCSELQDVPQRSGIREEEKLTNNFGKINLREPTSSSAVRELDFDNKIYCLTCYRRGFNTEEELNLHLRVHKKCCCPRCNDQFLLAEEQGEDLEISDVIECANCYQVFHTKNEHQKHNCCLYQSFESLFCDNLPVIFECQGCNGSFCSFEQYSIHDCPYFKKRKPKCIFCDYIFHIKYDAINHLIDEHGRCPHCHLECLARNLVIKHIHEEHYKDEM